VKLINVINQINRDIDEEYDNGDIIDWINRCSDDLTPIARIQASQSYAITAVTDSFTFHETRHRDYSMKVTDSHNESTFYYPVSVTDPQPKGYVAWGNSFTLQNGPTSGTITYYYYQKIAQMTLEQLNVEMQIDSEFHDLYILYGRGQIQFTEEDQKGNSDREDSMNMYLARKREFERHIRIKQATAETIEVV
jgi:hypothetical protein